MERGLVRKFLKGSGPVRDTLRGSGLLGQELGTSITGELKEVLDKLDEAEKQIELAEDALRRGDLDFASPAIHEGRVLLQEALKIVDQKRIGLVR